MQPRARQHPTAWLVIALSFDLILFASGGAESLDVRLAYSPAQAQAWLQALDSGQRLLFLRLGYVDLGFIAAYSLYLWKLARAWQCPRALAALTLIVGVADLIETIALLLAQSTWPNDASGMLTIASVATPIKWTASLFVACGLLAWRWRWRQNGQFVKTERS